ncbi:uncharacterized protein LOC121381973 [Gigantopelta aegis]|uniref:uncharacterized protein LOC121381973 n=1 Tax=Gigantopelta aegis TaxID=1735272 RepID=UPI001B88884C|nr:uncharacterized protein LOC121381973 [Gigantopelta aegis]
MHQIHLRQAKEKLHNEIHQTMKMYSNEKHHLLKQLANLRHDLTDLKLPEIASNVYDPYQTPRIEPKQHMTEKLKFHKSDKHRSKNQASSKKSSVKCDTDTSDYESDFEKSVSDTDQTLFGDHKDLDLIINDDKSVSDLPSNVVLGSHPNTQWYSGKYLRHSSLDHAAKSQTVQQKPNTALYPEISQKHIATLAVQDRQRCEIKLPTIKGINKKKVKFDGKTAVKLIPHEPNTNLTKMAYESQQRKQRSEKLPPIEDWKMRRAAKGQMRGRSSPTGIYLPPLKSQKQKRTLEVIPETLAESAEWKALYLNIHDEDTRNKTLSDILHAVRIRMQNNERSLKFGERRSPDKTDNFLCDYLLNSQSKKDRRRRGQIPSHAAERCFRRSNAVHLQNYLHKLSRQRRMIEHMAGEEYRLTHIVGHKHLQDALPM